MKTDKADYITVAQVMWWAIRAKSRIVSEATAVVYLASQWSIRHIRQNLPGLSLGIASSPNVFRTCNDTFHFTFLLYVGLEYR